MAEQQVAVEYIGRADATLSNVAASVTSAQLFAASSTAHHRTIFNDASSTLYVKYGTSASTTSHTVQLAPGAYYEFPQPLYLGVVHGVWGTASGAARMTEW